MRAVPRFVEMKCLEQSPLVQEGEQGDSPAQLRFAVPPKIALAGKWPLTSW